ncbi:mannose-6-phosphate isomerase [Histomonas meleagridis]|uniref:mannose-6-phosphate isomerase n=1 Tax=Histomonas meleagridis TaxID=135588 RepID=UPI00355968D0|nr:mannose-6-phosphate isomerase [Histomonas meleagridis]KAH0797311.1 mannose-6-phosphate isomerase [Histomonas meleagridis]
MEGNIIPLKCSSMQYEWGKKGSESLVFQLLKGEDNATLSESLPYAELWMGNHPKAPSRTQEGKTISEIEGCSELPFLFKVLSIKKPLSIQVHPNKETSTRLHDEDPENYPDANHKPEMGYFVSKTKLLYGFRPYNEIVDFFNRVPEFHDLIEPSILQQFIDNPSPNTLKEVLFRFFHKKSGNMPTMIHHFLENLEKYNLDQEIVDTIKSISFHFPVDIGIFTPLIMNIVVGEPGTALFIPTGVIHSYIYGDLIEVMSLSDNVIRAAMTPKHIDVDVLLSVLNFEPTPIHWVEPFCTTPNSQLFFPPLEPSDFILGSHKLGAGEAQNLPELLNESILLVLNGTCRISGNEYVAGSVLLGLKNAKVCIEALTDCHVLICTHTKVK